MQDESGKEIHRQKEFQARGSLWDNGITAYLVDYGVYSGSSTIWSYKWNGEKFDLNENKADYNIPPIDETDSPARIHDQEYEAVGSAGPKGLLDDFATIEADTKAMNKWYKDGSSQSMKQAHAFNLIIHRKMNGVRHFMIDTDQIDPKLTSQEAYLVFRANYMLKDVNGTWRKQEGKWDNNNKPIAPNK